MAQIFLRRSDVMQVLFVKVYDCFLSIEQITIWFLSSMHFYIQVYNSTTRQKFLIPNHDAQILVSEYFVAEISDAIFLSGNHACAGFTAFHPREIRLMGRLRPSPVTNHQSRHPPQDHHHQKHHLHLNSFDDTCKKKRNPKTKTRRLQVQEPDKSQTQ